MIYNLGWRSGFGDDPLINNVGRHSNRHDGFQNSLGGVTVEVFIFRKTVY